MMFPSALIIITVCLVATIRASTSVTTTATEDSSPQSSNNETFMYFAYGSNLLAKRIQLENPSAKRKTIGKLKNYKLDFITFSHYWNGCSADLIEDDGSDVWGTIWEIDMSNLMDLDRQEEVDKNLYKALTKTVETPTGEQITCRLYQKVVGSKEIYRWKDLPLERRPSITYLNCILNGAVESQLPDEYINALKTIPHNNRFAVTAAVQQICVVD